MRLRQDLVCVALLIGSMNVVAIDGNSQTAQNDAVTSSMAASQRARLVGTYRYAGSPEEEEARKAAIDHAVESLSFVIRSTARSRISATTQILGSYSFSFEPGKIVIHALSRPDMISGDKGEPTDYIYNGKRSTLTQVLAGDRMTQVFVSDDGSRENEFTLSPDGHALHLKVTLSSARLSNPVIYRLSYKRAD